MLPELYWIEGSWKGALAIRPRPRGGDWLEGEIRGWRRAGVNVVASLLTGEEMSELDLLKEAKLCQHEGIQFLSFPIPDRGVPPSKKTAMSFISGLNDLLIEGKVVAIHCRQGIGRSAFMAASLLVMSGATSDEAFLRISAARGAPVPDTVQQRAWVEDFSRSLPPVATRDR